MAGGAALLPDMAPGAEDPRVGFEAPPNYYVWNMRKEDPVSRFHVEGDWVEREGPYFSFSG